MFSGESELMHMKSIFQKSGFNSDRKIHPFFKEAGI